MRASSKARFAAILGSIALVCLLFVLTGIFLHSSQAIAAARNGTDEVLFVGPLATDEPASTSGSLSTEASGGIRLQGAGSAGPLEIGAPLSCTEPLVLSGSIVTGTNPVFTGRLIRNGVPSVCGESYTCSGVQSTSTNFSYEDFDFINSSSAWQCVDVAMDARNCGQQVYSAAYLNSFNSANLCENIQGAMGYSTSELYGYSFMVPPNTNFRIVNNTIGILAPSANCSDYTMTVTLCSSQPSISVSEGSGLPIIKADNAGKALVPVPVTFSNQGDFTGSVDASTVSNTVKVSVLDGKPAAVQALFGKPGAIVRAGDTITQLVPLKFSGSQFQCLSRMYLVENTMSMTSQPYYCNGFNPPSAEVFAGSILKDDAFSEDDYAFESQAGTHITVTVDTVDAATAFDIEACLSDTPDGQCLPGFQGDDDFNCTFAPPAFGCPRFGGLLPADSDGDNIYYLKINSGSGVMNFAGNQGDYRATTLVTSGPTGACPGVGVLDNGPNSFLSLAGLDSVVPTSTVQATVTPILIQVPPSNPSAPGCSTNYLPGIFR